MAADIIICSISDCFSEQAYTASDNALLLRIQLFTTFYIKFVCISDISMINECLMTKVIYLI